MSTQTTETSAAVRVARETLAHTSTAMPNVPEMSRVELCSLIGRLQGSLLALVQYVHLIQQIARHEQSTRETQARIDAQTKHTGDLDHALATALRHSLATHADSIHFEVMARDDDGTPLRFRVAAWKDIAQWSAENSNPLKALEVAMAKLRTATGDTR